MTGFYYLDDTGRRWEIDDLEKADDTGYVHALRVEDQKKVTLNISKVEVE